MSDIVWGVVGIVLLALFYRNFAAIESRLDRWLTEPTAADCRYVELHKGVTK